MAPLRRRREPRGAGRAPRRDRRRRAAAARRAAGRGVAGFLGDEHAELADCLLAPGEPEETAKALLDRAAAAADVVDLFGLPEGSRAAGAAGGALALIQRAEAPVLDMPDGFEAVYEAKFASKRRYEHRRKRKKLAELGELRVEVARRPEEVAAALFEEGFELHARRWHGLPDLSGFVTETGRAFHRDGYARLAAADVLRIVSLRLDGRAIAFHAYFALGGALYSDRMAYDLALARLLARRPEHALHAEEAGREGLTRVEFLGGTEEYKLQLADRFEPLLQGFGLASSPRGRAYATARRGLYATRRRLKRSETVRRLYYEGARAAPAAQGLPVDRQVAVRHRRGRAARLGEALRGPARSPAGPGPGRLGELPTAPAR